MVFCVCSLAQSQYASKTTTSQPIVAIKAATHDDRQRRSL